MIKVRPNRFFLKNTPASGSILPLISEMPDLPIAATSQILDFSTGDINKSYVVSGNINNELTAGRYDLIGGYLRMFAS